MRAAGNIKHQPLAIDGGERRPASRPVCKVREAGPVCGGIGRIDMKRWNEGARVGQRKTRANAAFQCPIACNANARAMRTLDDGGARAFSRRARATRPLPPEKPVEGQAHEPDRQERVAQG